MTRPPLFKVYFLYHGPDLPDIRRHQAEVEKAFEWVRQDRSVSDLDEVPDVWERVRFKSIPDKATWEAEECMDAFPIPTLFVVMVTDAMASDPGMREVLDSIATLMPKPPESATCDLLAFSFSSLALGKLPPLFSKRQVGLEANLGESRIAPHKLGLIALHRARPLLGAKLKPKDLKIFISHAKSDGIFLAISLKESIEKVPELDPWYDASDIGNGSDWISGILDAASSCIFLAVRTNAYEQRKICREEFMTALLHGVPIVVVDALMEPISDSSPLPYSCVPNVRVPDGNTYRILRVMLREHLRVLLMQAMALELLPPGFSTRVWPRLPSPAAVKRACSAGKAENYWLVPKALCYDAEFLELRDRLATGELAISLEHLETFRPLPVIS